MTSFESVSGRQFETDPISGQIFYREPIHGSYSQWSALEPSDYHMPPPATQNVNTSHYVHVFCVLTGDFSHRH